MTHYVYAGAAPWSGASPTDQPGGLFRQAIGSREWQLLTNGLPTKAEIRAIAIHPQNSQIVYIGTQDGPYRSMDGGDHWEAVESSRFREGDLVDSLSSTESTNTLRGCSTASNLP